MIDWGKVWKHKEENIHNKYQGHQSSTRWILPSQTIRGHEFSIQVQKEVITMKRATVIYEESVTGDAETKNSTYTIWRISGQSQDFRERINVESNGKNINRSLSSLWTLFKK